MKLMDRGIQLAAEANEPLDTTFVRKHVMELKDAVRVVSLKRAAVATGALLRRESYRASVKRL